MAGLFAFEGPDGVGKSTVVQRLEKRLRDAGVPCARLGFPGNEQGTLGYLVYQLHHHQVRFSLKDLSAASLQLLHVAAHLDAIERRIVPLLEAGITVLLDRYWWSTWVYGTVSGVPASQLNAMLGVEKQSWGNIKPTAVFLLKRHSAKCEPALVSIYDQLVLQEKAFYPVVVLDNDRHISLTVEDALLAVITNENLGSAASSKIEVREKGFKSTKKQRASVASNTGRAPLVFSKLEPAVPSEVYDTYWRFAAERQAIFFRQVHGEGNPITKDPILLQHKFTNAYRASDRVSQFLIRHVIYQGDQSPAEVFFRTILFKLFNRIGTWRLLEEVLGSITYRDYRFDRYDKVLSRALASGGRIYSAAYIMPAARAFGSDQRKHRTHLRLLERMMVDSVPQRLAEARTMREAFELLRSYPMMGNFLAYQFTIDLNYSGFLNFNEMEFVVPGPGARDGLQKCFKSSGGLAEADLIRLVTDRQEVEFERLGTKFQSLWGRPLQLIDCQNLFCEVDKYARLAHPDISGLSGRTRIKQFYRPTPTRIVYWYPTKWGINEMVAREQAHSSTANVQV